MNDSFLEDLELVEIEERPGGGPRNAERNITRRGSQPSPPGLCSKRVASEQRPKSEQRAKGAASTPLVATNRGKSVETRERERSNVRGPSGGGGSESLKSTERRLIPEIKLTLPENAARLEAARKKLNSKEGARSSCGEISRSSDVSGGENARPSDSHRETVSESSTPSRERNRGSGDAPGRNERTQKFEVAVLNSVKEIVSTYTKNESNNILRAMQEIYVNSQANLVKLLLRQSEDIVNEANLGKRASGLGSLVEENASLRNDVAALVSRNEDLQRENVRLRLRCKELARSGGLSASKENSRPTAVPREGSSSKVRHGKLSELRGNSK